MMLAGLFAQLNLLSEPLKLCLISLAKFQPIRIRVREVLEFWKNSNPSTYFLEREAPMFNFLL